MKTSFDPLQRLTTQEAIRFVGSIGGVSTDAPKHFSSALELFIGREVRTASELAERILASSGCKPTVAAVSVEEAAALGLIAPIPSPTLRHKRFLLDDQGRVINAMRRHREWPQRNKLLYLRPMFEANGDYLLQAMDALDGPNESPAEAFRALVQKMALAKVDQLPANQTGSKWDAYRQALTWRKRSIFGEAGATIDGGLTLESMQRQRQKASTALLNSLRSKSAPTGIKGSPGVETSTLEHHFARCRAWLEALGLAQQREGRGYKLTASGEHLLDFFRRVLRTTPLSIPPSASTLWDCFRLDSSDVKDIWGSVVNEDFWESALLALETVGSYEPTRPELKKRFDASFDAVRITGIPEAMLSPLRQTLFLGFLWEGRPVKDIGRTIEGEASIPALHPDQYGFGRNRQGRLAYLFRKATDIK